MKCVEKIGEFISQEGELSGKLKLIIDHIWQHKLSYFRSIKARFQTISNRNRDNFDYDRIMNKVLADESVLSAIELAVQAAIIEELEQQRDNLF